MRALQSVGLLAISWLAVVPHAAAQGLGPAPRVQAPPTGNDDELDEPPPPPAAERHPPPGEPAREPPPGEAPSAPPPFAAAQGAASESSAPAPLPAAEQPPPDSDWRSRPEPLYERPRAPEPPEPWTVRPFTLEGHIGFGTPVGTLGIMFDYMLAPAFSLAGGIGLGSGPKDNAGVHGAVMVRARPARGKKNALEFGAGLSTGPYRRFQISIDGPTNDVQADWAHFLQLEIGWERRSEKGFLFRMSGGIAYLLNPGDLKCTSGSDFGFGTSSSCSAYPARHKEEILPVIEFAFGHSF